MAEGSPLNVFLTKMSTNQVRTANLFELEISIPSYPDIQTIFNDLNITMYAEGFELPSRTLNFTEVAYKGYPVPIATTTTMTQEHSLTIRADMNGELRRAFLAWQAETSNPAISDGSIFEGDRRIREQDTVKLHLIGNDMRESIETYVLYGVKVAEVGALSMSNNTSPGVATFSVSLKSIYWEILESKEGKLTRQK